MMIITKKCKNNNTWYIYMLFLAITVSCVDNSKQHEMVYYYRKSLHFSEDNDTTYSYRAFIVKDTINGLKKIKSYRYDSEGNELIPSLSMRVRLEEWGVSQIQGIFDMPLLRIDTHNIVIWDIPDEPAFSQRYKFIKKDTLYIKPLKKVMPVYLFYIPDGYAYLYFSEDFVLLKALPENDPLEPFFIEELIKESEAPKEFRLLMEDVLH